MGLLLPLSVVVLAGWAQAQRGGNPCNTDLLFVLDKTGSVTSEFAGMKDYVKGVAKVLSIGPQAQRLGLVVYHGTARSRRLLFKKIGSFGTKERFLAEINKINRADATTHVARALRKANELLRERKEKRLAVVIVVTDGNQFDLDAAVIKERDKILAIPNTSIYAVAAEQHVGKGHSSEEGHAHYNLKGLTVITGDKDRVFVAPNHLDDTIRELGRTIGCEAPPPPTNAPRTRPPVVTPRPTRATTERPSGCELDLLLIIDSSSSVDEIHEEYVRRAQEIVRSVKVSPRHTQVAMVRYSSKFNSDPEFHFNTYADESSVLGGIVNAEYRGGMTNTAWAIQLGIEEFSNTKYGSRPEIADKMAVIFTDGFSQHDPAGPSQDLRKLGVEVHASGVQRGFFVPNSQELETIAGNANNVHTGDEEFQAFLRSLNRYNCR